MIDRRALFGFLSLPFTPAPTYADARMVERLDKIIEAAQELRSQFDGSGRLHTLSARFLSGSLSHRSALLQKAIRRGYP
ncbi:hypothetical protein [Methylobacterium sp. 1030]|uniref:hypothetical protein n=1 Tax=Methylobacterium sp. 1030 TaxID=3156404 RepID=UPI00339B502F